MLPGVITATAEGEELLGLRLGFVTISILAAKIGVHPSDVTDEQACAISSYSLHRT